MFSPPRYERSRADDSHLPKGGCRYILSHPELKGQRCACVGFALSRSVPGSTCDCGHQACYHIPEKENSSVERQELEALRKKVDWLVEQLERERCGGRGGLVDRIGCLEELVDRSRAESEVEFKNVYRQQSSLFQNIGALNHRTPYYDDTIEGLVDTVQGFRNQLVELDDASMRLEDKVDSLGSFHTAAISRRRRASTPPSKKSDESDECLSPTPRESRFPLHPMMADEATRIRSFRDRVSSIGSGSQSWTVHVSLLPTSSQPFPFEKDTAAYKRCLSRGLHQVVVVPDTDSASFRNAVNDAFCAILHGRPWHPLVARLCDAKSLRGLPMLRPLDDYLIGSNYDADFLQLNCAVNDESGKILDLYIAMAEDTLSWAELREVAPFKTGLEASWAYDLLLDGPSNTEALHPDTTRPAAGDILTAWSPTLKRNASEISGAASFGPSDSANARAKLRRPYAEGPVEVVGRHAEAV
ncbi:hypothetical protein LZ554_006785 [Drepanopeziza brunnea f. sp. 'monogermtubi']|nr:hypothetical protein LZ554_006785 [Drepanopeziza brunnea f. sp. 'monogermtubi']